MTNNIQQIRQGERLSFYQLIYDKKYHIEIPIIQRDYAQGRSSFEEKRVIFLKALKSYLNDNQPNRDLDFIYGTVEQSFFIPLDGQQRLTTLFLLHWYLALKDGQIESFRGLMTLENNSKFRYKTRASSTDFFNALLQKENGISLAQLTPNNPKEYPTIASIIQDSGWYFDSWKKDPTVQSILVMMDAIHQIFKDCDNYYKRLTDVNNPIITFMFLDIGEYGLTDDLYIKMNSRGKPLTNFENFKARLEQEIKVLFEGVVSDFTLKFGDKNEPVSVQKYFSHQIDTEWTNLFWKYKTADNEIDDKILNFIKTLFINYLAENSLTDFVKKYRSKKHLSFLEYKFTGVLNKAFIKKVIAVLDVLKNGSQKIELRLGANFFYYNEANEFEKCLNGNFKLRGFVQFYAYYEYLIRWQSNDGLDEWMRMIHNLTTNVDYNNEQEFIRALNGVASLIAVSNRIVSHFKDNGKVTGFNEKQIKEERIKASLFDKLHWKEAIKKAEQHGYFTGQIGFLLNFSGIEGYYDEHKNCNWENDNVFLETFKNYYRKAVTVFGEHGLKEFKDYAWRRALLSKGDYMLFAKRNWSFLVDTNRDISWKRLLFDGGIKVFNEDYRQERRSYVKALFNDELFDINDPQNSLEKIIEISKGIIDDWRIGFIDTPQLFSYLKKQDWDKSLNIRHDSEEDETTYLLKGQQMNGRYGELQTLHFFYNHLESSKEQMPPFKINYHTGKGYSDYPCISFYDWNNYYIHIYYYHGNFQIRFYNMNEKPTGIDIQSVLDKHKFKVENDYSTISSDYASLKAKLEAICADFNKLNTPAP